MSYPWHEIPKIEAEIIAFRPTDGVPDKDPMVRVFAAKVRQIYNSQDLTDLHMWYSSAGVICDMAKKYEIGYRLSSRNHAFVGDDHYLITMWAYNLFVAGTVNRLADEETLKRVFRFIACLMRDEVLREGAFSLYCVSGASLEHLLHRVHSHASSVQYVEGIKNVFAWLQSLSLFSNPAFADLWDK